MEIGACSHVCESVHTITLRQTLACVLLYEQLHVKVVILGLHFPIAGAVCILAAAWSDWQLLTAVLCKRTAWHCRPVDA